MNGFGGEPNYYSKKVKEKMTKEIIARDGNLIVTEEELKIPLHKLMKYYTDELLLCLPDAIERMLFHIEVRFLELYNYNKKSNEQIVEMLKNDEKLLKKILMELKDE